MDASWACSHMFVLTPLITRHTLLTSCISVIRSHLKKHFRLSYTHQNLLTTHTFTFVTNPLLTADWAALCKQHYYSFMPGSCWSVSACSNSFIRLILLSDKAALPVLKNYSIYWNLAAIVSENRMSVGTLKEMLFLINTCSHSKSSRVFSSSPFPSLYVFLVSPTF